MIEQATGILTDVFGYKKFRPLQEEAIRRVLDRQDTLVVMPTGGGKSLIYQIPAQLFDGLTIVVSPLISLMKDQVEQLHEFGISAVFLNSSLSPEEYNQNVELLKRGDVSMLYVAPETLMMDKTVKLLDQLKVDCFTIDEAHCISEWGHDFRPDYRQLAEFRKRFDDVVTLALTATATPRVRKDIRDTLEMEESETFIASFDRKNLLLKVVDKENPLDQTLDFLYTRKGQSGIIYCFSRRQTSELADDLSREGYSVRPYHAGLSEAQRNRNQDAFIKDDVDIIVATVAFGMGINKPNVRFVVHYDMPKNIESYYQQIGRAGRDGLKSDCLLLFGYADTRKIEYFINQKEGQEKDVARKHLDDLLKFLETTECRRKPLMAYFGEKYQQDSCDMCDNCLQDEADLSDLTTPAQKFLSCVVRTGEKFGAHYIADVLRGSEQKKVLENGHDEITTHGIGTEFSKDQWVQLSRLLIRKNLLEKDGQYSGLKLAGDARDVLDGTERVLGILDRTKTSTVAAAARASSEIEEKYDEKLFEKLREKRKELADAKNIPPYAVFPDTTLIEMSYYFPKSEESLEHIYGVGSAKLQRYGDTFLSIIKDYTQEHNIEERSKGIKKKAKKSSGKKKYQRIGEEFNAGKSIDHLCEEHGVKLVTILKHLKDYVDEEGHLRVNGLKEASELSERKQDEVLKVMDDKGASTLRPTYVALDKSVSYNELRIMQLLYLAKQD